MARYKLSRKAIADLDEIWDYTVAAWSESQAEKYYSQIVESIMGLSSLPNGKSRSYDVVKPGLWGYHVGHHIVFYKKKSDGSVWVNRILHEKMDFVRHF